MKVPVVVDSSQKRLDNFFKPFARHNSSSPNKQPATPAPTGPVVDSTRSRNLIDELTSPSPPNSSNHTVNLHQEKTSNTPKRSREDSLSDVPLPTLRRPAKSPRLSPESCRTVTNKDSCDLPSASSALSSLKSPTPPLSDFNESNTRRVAEPTKTNSSFKWSGASFNSTSSFGTSSQRVIRDGETIAVRNSDDDASDDSVEDLDDLLGPIGAPAATSSPLTDATNTPTPPPDLALNIRRSKRLDKERLPDKKPVTDRPERKVKFNLAALSARARKEDKRRQDAEASMDEIRAIDDARRLALEAKSLPLDELVRRHGPEEGRERFMEAISRTEALSEAKEWCFFDRRRFGKNTLFDVDHLERLRSVRNSTFNQCLQTQRTLELALVSGVLLRAASQGCVPQAYTSVFFEMSVSSARKDVRDACLNILQHTSQSDAMLAKAQDIFRSLGAGDDAMDTTRPIEPMLHLSEPRSKSRHSRAQLSHFMTLIARFPEWFTSEDDVTLIILLFRLSIDDTIDTDTSLRSLLIQAIGALLSKASTSHDSIIQQLYQQTTDVDFRMKIIEIIPVTNPPSSLFRRRLAACWFFDDAHCSFNHPSTDSNSSTHPPLIPLDQVPVHLQSHPEIYKIRKTTDYKLLKTKIDLLSISLGNGDFTPTEGPNRRDEERSFNESVDQLANAVRGINADILDTGASHASRIEAKDALDTFASRLLYSVRTRPRPRKDILGGVLDEDDPRKGQRAILQFFREKKNKGIKMVEGETGGDVKVADEISGAYDAVEGGTKGGKGGELKSPETDTSEHFVDAVEELGAGDL